MNMYAAGIDHCHQLGIEPTATFSCYDASSNFMNAIFNNDWNNIKYVGVLTRVPIDLEGIQCVSSGLNYSVIIKVGKVFIAGEYSKNQFKTFTEVKIDGEPIFWAACGGCFTLYLTESGKALVIHDLGGVIDVKLARKAVSVFAGNNFGGIIDEEGAINIIDSGDLKKPPQRFSLDAPAVDLVCCNKFICALTSDGRVLLNYKFETGPQRFVEVQSLEGVKIIKLSGFTNTCAALSSAGRVFMYGNNSYGQLGNGTKIENYESFTEVHFDEEIKDVSCSYHTLFLTKSNMIYGCGYNKFNQLLKKTEDGLVLSPTYITTIEADQVIARGYHSFVISGTGKFVNQLKNETMSLHLRISDLRSRVAEQSELIAQLNEKCNEFQQHEESKTKLIEKMKEENKKLRSLIEFIIEQED